MSRMKKRSAVAALLLLILLIVIGKSGTDGYNRTFGRGELVASRGQMHAEDGMEAGLFCEGPGVSLMPGTFSFTITYVADAEGSSVAVYGDGRDEVPVYTQMLPVSDGTTPAEFVCAFPDEIKDLQVHVSYGGHGYFEMVSIKVKSEGWICGDYVAIALFAAILFLGYLWLRKRNQDRTGLESPANRYLLITGAALLISLPLCTDYIRGSADIAYHLNRIEGIRAALLTGQFPVRVHSNALDGFGYGSALFYPELFLYFPAILRILGVSSVTAFKLCTASMNLIAAWSMYLAASQMFRNKEAGILASLLYVTAVFRLGMGYYVGLYGCYMAMSFLPVFCLGVYEIVAGDPSKWGYAAAGFTLVLQSHILSAVISCILAVAACGIYWRSFFRKVRIGAAVKAAGLALLLNLWFILPLLYMMREPIDLAKLQDPFSEFTVPLAQLFKGWMNIGFQTMQEGVPLDNAVPVTWGAALLMANLALLLPVVWMGVKNPFSRGAEWRKAARLGIWGLVMVFLMSRLMPWKVFDKVPVVNAVTSFMQYPWRLFPFALLFFCMSGAAGLWLLVRQNGQWRRTAYSLVLLTAFLTAAYYLDGNNGEAVLIRQTELVDSGNIAHGEYLYEGTEIGRLSEWAGKITVQKREDGSECNVSISDYEKTGGSLSFYYVMTEPEAAYVELPLLYYPGYTTWINGQKTGLERGEQNVLRLWLSPGTEGRVTARYTGLRSWNAATWISLVTFMAVIAYYGAKYWKKYRSFIK